MATKNQTSSIVLSRLSDKEFDRLRANRRKADSRFRSKISDDDIEADGRRRFAIHSQAYALLLQELQQSSDGVITHKAAHHLFYPDKPFVGNQSDRRLGEVRDKIIQYCVANRLAILTVRIVRTDSRKVKQDAKLKIFKRCRELGYRMHAANADEFFDEQVAATAELLN